MNNKDYQEEPREVSPATFHRYNQYRNRMAMIRRFGTQLPRYAGTAAMIGTSYALGKYGLKNVFNTVVDKGTQALNYGGRVIGNIGKAIYSTPFKSNNTNKEEIHPRTTKGKNEKSN